MYGKETHPRSLELTGMRKGATTPTRKGDALQADIRNRGMRYLSESKHRPVDDITPDNHPITPDKISFTPDNHTDTTISTTISTNTDATNNAEPPYEVDPRWRARLIAMYARYDPDKLNPNSENVLEVALRNVRQGDRIVVNA